MKPLFQLAFGLFLLVPTPGLATEPVFVHLAEGFTSKSQRVGIEAAQRMFSAPMFPEICTGLQAPTRLIVVRPEPLLLVNGQWFPYRRLVVLAVDAAGTVLPPVPIGIEVEETPALLLGSAMTADGKLFPVHTGDFRFRLATRCEDPSIIAVIKAKIVEP